MHCHYRLPDECLLHGMVEPGHSGDMPPAHGRSDKPLCTKLSELHPDGNTQLGTPGLRRPRATNFISPCVSLWEGDVFVLQGCSGGLGGSAVEVCGRRCAERIEVSAAEVARGARSSTGASAEIMCSGEGGRSGGLPEDALVELDRRCGLRVGIEGWTLCAIWVRGAARLEILRWAARRGWSRDAGGQVQVREDHRDGQRIAEEGDHAHGAVALRAAHGEALEASRHEGSPSPLSGRAGGGRLRDR